MSIYENVYRYHLVIIYLVNKTSLGFAYTPDIPRQMILGRGECACIKLGSNFCLSAIQDSTLLSSPRTLDVESRILLGILAKWLCIIITSNSKQNRSRLRGCIFIKTDLLAK